jgi:hypothetical protein
LSELDELGFFLDDVLFGKKSVKCSHFPQYIPQRSALGLSIFPSPKAFA